MQDHTCSQKTDARHKSLDDAAGGLRVAGGGDIASLERLVAVVIGSAAGEVRSVRRLDHAVDQQSGNPQPTQTGRPPLTGVINHISWGVQPWDTNAVEAELRRRGLNPRPDMVGDNFKSFHVNDPDGWDLQISNQTKDSRGGGGA